MEIRTLLKTPFLSTNWDIYYFKFSKFMGQWGSNLLGFVL